AHDVRLAVNQLIGIVVDPDLSGEVRHCFLQHGAWMEIRTRIELNHVAVVAIPHLASNRLFPACRVSSSRTLCTRSSISDRRGAEPIARHLARPAIAAGNRRG